MVTFLFRTIPSKWNTSRAVHRSIPVSHAQAINQHVGRVLPTCQEPKLARSLVDLESMLLHCHCLLNFTGTLCCYRSSDLSVFCDRCSTASNFRYHRSINLGSLINSNCLYNQQIDSSTPLGLLRLLWHVVQASYGSHSQSHHLLPAPPPV